MAKKKKVEIPTMVVTSKVKEFVAENYGVRMSGDFIPELNEKVAQMVDAAVKRCEANSRATLRPGDL